jgi:hypothetical protein
MPDDMVVAPADEAGVIVTADTPAEVSENDALGAIWEKYERDNGAVRDEQGRFASDRPVDANEGVSATEEAATTEAPVEGAEMPTETAPVVTIAIPPTLTGLDDVWAKIPPEAQEAISANQQKLHKTLSDHGRFVAAYKPVADVFSEFKDYFGGPRGNYKPDEATRYLFGLQKSMDDNPIETLMQIADTYELRPKLQAMFAAAGGAQPGADGQPATAPDYTNALLAKIEGLERTIQQISDPSRVDARITARLDEERTTAEANDIISRTSKEMPLYADVEADLPFFIERAWAKLGDTASKDAVLKTAYDMAVNADPDLRKKVAPAAVPQAQPAVAAVDPKRVADARKANDANIRSTATGKPRAQTEDEELAAIYAKHKR